MERVRSINDKSIASSDFDLHQRVRDLDVLIYTRKYRSFAATSLESHLGQPPVEQTPRTSVT